MGFELAALKLLGRMSREDILVLLLIIFLFTENKCDRNMKLALLIIFISGLEQGLLAK